jgi:hypothetical protein
MHNHVTTFRLLAGALTLCNARFSFAHGLVVHIPPEELKIEVMPAEIDLRVV